MDLWPLSEDSHVVERIPQILGSKSFLSSDRLNGNYHPRVMNAGNSKVDGFLQDTRLRGDIQGFTVPRHMLFGWRVGRRDMSG